MKKKTIKPELLGGFRDYLPEEMIPRQEMFDKIRTTFESFGFMPLETPSLERSSVLGTDKDEFKMEVYRFNDTFGAEGQDVTLRFDLTVPLSRVLASNPDLLKPFKRYQRGSVWRKESPQAGRFREFTQFDADIVGSDSLLADTEILVLMYGTMKALGIDNFIIRFNNRKILNGLPEAAGFDPAQASKVFRIIDKIDKIGEESVLLELGAMPVDEDDKSAVNLSAESVARIEEFLNLGKSSGDIMASAKQFFQGVSIAEEGIFECEEIIKNLRELEIPAKNWNFDLSIARGLGYYTGPVFETMLTDIPEIGSVFSGGRYDDLVMRFTGERMPAVGASVGVDRLFTALEKLGRIEKKRSVTKVLFAILNDTPKGEVLKLSQQLREKGVPNELYLREGMLKNQLVYAIKRDIPFLAILGGEEAVRGEIKLKNLQTREEEYLSFADFISRM